MRILLLSRYGSLGASSRVRSILYLSYCKKNGINVDIEPLFSDEYLTALYSRKSRWRMVLSGYFHRFMVLLTVRKYNLIWLEKEIFPFLPASFERFLNLLGIPYVVDYDDAWFHRYDQHPGRFIRLVFAHKIDAVMRHAALVVAGNEYIADHANAAGARQVEIVPTVVDLEQYKVGRLQNIAPLTVGWIGSPATTHYLLELASVFESLKLEFDIRFVAIGANVEELKGLPVEVWPWSEDTEVQSIQACDIGIMPLVDSSWERGKCGYKLIQFMACGLPVVASPVGVNKQIVEHGVNGFLAKDLQEWKQVLRQLLNDHELRKSMGRHGRERVEAWYSLQIQSPRVEAFMSEVLK